MKKFYYEVILDLKNFITESLYQIVAGVNAAQKKIAGFNGEGESNFQAMISQKAHKPNVYFDVALSVLENQSEPPGSTLLVMGLSNSNSKSYEQAISLVSRVKFSVSLNYAQASAEKSPYAFLNAH